MSRIYIKLSSRQINIYQMGSSLCQLETKESAKTKQGINVYTSRGKKDLSSGDLYVNINKTK